MSGRILFPFTDSTVSRPTLDAVVQLAGSRDATLVPACVVIVPRHLSLEAPAPVRAMEAALSVLELIEQLAGGQRVPVDARIQSGRTDRDALAAIVEHERFDTLVVPAESFSAADVAWLTENAPGEVRVLRAPRPSAAAS